MKLPLVHEKPASGNLVAYQKDSPSASVSLNGSLFRSPLTVILTWSVSCVDWTASDPYEIRSEFAASAFLHLFHDENSDQITECLHIS
jgi:hypothetical protein